MKEPYPLWDKGLQMKPSPLRGGGLGGGRKKPRATECVLMTNPMLPGTNSPIAIGNGAGFWGDNLDAPYLLARDGKLDVLTLEYLAELTLAILSHMRSKDPSAGYITDFPDLVDRLVPVLRDQSLLRIVTNAGGLNPVACAARCGEILASAGRGDLPIGVVTGDDVLPRVKGWLSDGVPLDHMETGEP